MPSNEIFLLLEVSSEFYGGSIPDYWKSESQTHADETSIADSDKSDSVFDDIKNEFYKTVSKKYSIISIKMIQNCRLWSRFLGTKKPEDSERLWHGCPKSSTYEISQLVCVVIRKTFFFFLLVEFFRFF